MARKRKLKVGPGRSAWKSGRRYWWGQYFHQGADLSVYTPEDLDAVGLQLEGPPSTNPLAGWHHLRTRRLSLR